MGCFKKWAIAVAVVLVVTAATRGAEAQAPTTSCASKLVSCADSMNSTTNPPASCCDPLKEVVTKELSCLCNLYNTPGLLESLGINSTQALLLPGRCKIPGNISACSKASAPAPAPASKSPPATPGNGSNGVGTIGWTGILAILLVWASMIIG